MKAPELVAAWKRANVASLPLARITEQLLIGEIAHYASKGIISVKPSWLGPVELVNYRNSCEEIKGAADRFKKQNKELRRISNSIEYSSPVSFFKKRNALVTSLIAQTAEARMASHIKSSGYDVKFRKEGGADMEIEGSKSALTEVKSVHQPVLEEMAREQAQQNRQGKTLQGRLSQPIIVALLCKDMYNPIQRAFDEQKSGIAIVDVSGCYSAFSLAAASSLSRIDFPFNRALDNAVSIANLGKQAVVACAHVAGSRPRLLGLTFDRQTVERIGGFASLLESDLKKRKFEGASFYEMLDIIGKTLEL